MNGVAVLVMPERSHVNRGLANDEKKNVGLFCFVLLLVALPIVSAISLDTNTVLNTTSSNSSITFTIPITVSNFTVESMNITLNDIVCSNGGTPKGPLIWAVPNANLDTVELCKLTSKQISSTNQQGICNNLTGGIAGFSSSFIAVLSIFGLIMVLGVVSIMIYALKFSEEGLNLTMVAGAVVGIAILSILLVVAVIAIGFTCTLG